MIIMWQMTVELQHSLLVLVDDVALRPLLPVLPPGPGVTHAQWARRHFNLVQIFSALRQQTGRHLQIITYICITQKPMINAQLYSHSSRVFFCSGLYHERNLLRIRQLSRQLSWQLSQQLLWQLSKQLSRQLFSRQLSRQLSRQPSRQVLSRQLSRQLSWQLLSRQLTWQLSRSAAILTASGYISTSMVPTI